MTDDSRSLLRSTNISQSLLISLLGTAVPVCLLSIIAIIAPGYPWLAIIIPCWLVALEATGTTIWLRHFDRLALNKTYYRAAEFIVIAVAARLFAWAVTNGWPQSGQWRSYLLQPSLFFDGYYVVTLLLLFAAWTWVNNLSHIFHNLALSSAESNYYGGKQASGDRPIPLNRVQLLENFFQQWLWGGIFLALCAALTTFDLTELTAVRNPFSLGRLGLRPEVLLAALIYFLAGLWLLSQGRLAVMKARWLTGRMVKQSPIERQWQRTSLVTLLVVAVIAAFLPIGSTFFISRILNTLIVSFIFLFNFIVFLLSTLFLSILLLFRGANPGEPVNEPPVFPTALPALGESLPPPAGPSIIAGSIFWLVVLVVAIIAFIFFWRERGYRLPSWRQLWRGLQQWWHQLWHNVGVQAAKLQSLRPTPNKAKESRPFRPPWRYLRLNALSPREQIRYFYLSTVRRASDKGVARPEQATPLEFAQELRENWPDTTADIADLTDAFHKARYSPDTIDAPEATAVKSVWQRLRAHLRKRS